MNDRNSFNPHPTLPPSLPLRFRDASRYKNRGREIPLFALLTLISLIGIAAMAYATTRGPGIGGDATIYITSARNLLSGHGLGLIEPDGSFRLLPYTPPLFPLLLAFFGLPGFDLIQVARWLNVLLFGGSIFLIGFVFLRFTRSAIFSLAAAVIVMLSPVLARVYAWAMAEPLFLFTGFLGFTLSLAYARSLRRSSLIWAGIACGLSFLARYIGVAFLATACLAVLLFSHQTWVKRLLNAIALGLVGLVPMAIWLVVDLFATRTVASRSLESGLSLFTRLRSAWAPLRELTLNWLVPDSWIDNPPYPHALNQFIWLAAILGLIGLIALVLWRLAAASRQVRSSQWGWTLLAGGLSLLIVVYMLVAVGVYITTFPPITLDNRMFVPMHIAVLLLVLCLAGMLATLEKGRRLIVLGAGLLCLALLGSYAYRTPRIIQQTHQAGLGYLMDVWQQSETVRAIQNLPADKPIVTNELTAVLFFTGRSAYPVQEVASSYKQDLTTVYGSDPADPSQQAFRSGAALILFDTIQQQLANLYGEQSETRLDALTKGLFEAYHGSDGAIYYYEKP